MLPLEKVLPPPSLEIAQRILKEELAPPEPGQKKVYLQRLVELEIYHKDGSKIWVEIHASLIRDAYDNPVEILGVTRDITERKKTEEALRISEERFRSAFEDAAIGMALVGIHGQFLQVNHTLCEILGYTEKELLGLNFQVVMYSEDLDLDLDHVQQLLSGKVRSAQTEKRYFHKFGHLVWVLVTSTLVRDSAGGPLYFVSQFQDITERKRTEDKIRAYQKQLRSLASKLSLTEEKERRRIATDLHDHIGQALAVSKIKLGQLQQTVANPAWSESMDQIRDLIEQAIQYSRSLTTELSPPVLYELGFEAGVQWLLEKLRKDHGIATSFHDDGKPKSLSDDIRIVLFQAVRELLTNVVKHARAQAVNTLVFRESDTIGIEINDNGIGFDEGELTANQHKRHAFGLFHIRERLDHLGGRFSITSRPGGGTKVRLAAPLKKEG
jgi:PAS domain S-box-containing protein